MELFNYENFNLTINDKSVLCIAEFRDILESDKSEDKKKALKMFEYLHLLCHWRSPYVNFTEDERKKASQKDANLSDEEVKSDLIVNGEKKYLELLNSNLKLSMIKDIRDSIINFRQYYKQFNMDDKIKGGARNGDFLYAPEKYLKIVADSHKIFEQIDYLEKTLKEELSSGIITRRGGHKKGWDE